MLVLEETPRLRGLLYRKDMRLGGQYVTSTGPMRLLRGTVPHVRESHECVRLSPRTK
jgi:hypothetical protein